MKSIILFTFLAFTMTICGQITPGQTIRLIQNDKSLSIQNSSITNAASVVSWTDTNVPSQRWVVEDVDAGNGTIYLRNCYSGYYLGSTGSFSNGTPIYQVPKTRTRCAWLFSPVEGKENVYYIYAGGNNRICLASAESVSDGSPITTVLTTKVSDDRALWTVEVVDEQPTTLTSEICTEMMHDWQAQYYHKASVGHVIGKGGWWGDAEMFEVVLDAYETTGNEEYATMFDELYNNFCQRNGTSWTGNSYNDDISWMCIACTRAYLLTGKTDYLTRARSNFDAMYKRADAYGNGTLIWCQGKTGTNSCINGPASVCACYLGIATGSDSYFEKAARTYAGEREWLYNIKNGVFNGQVYDSYSTTEHKVSNTWSSTYNQGTCLGAAVMLYNHFGDKQYLTDADKIWSWTKSNMANSEGIIKVCQTVSGDLTGFKGILMRYIRRYAADLGHPECYDFMANNAFRAYNNRNSKGISMSAWLTKTPENFWYSDGKDFSTDGVGAFTALSAAFNAHIGVIDKRNAYEPMEGEKFNFICGSRVDTDDDSTTYSTLFNGSSMGYRNVDFGNETASHLYLKMRRYRANSKLEVYADAPNATSGILLCTLSEPTENTGWGDVLVQLDQPLTGNHNIYMVASGTRTIKLLSVDKFQFMTDQMATSIYNIPLESKVSDTRIFDLQGRLVSFGATRFLHGVYVRGGQKILIK